MFRINDNMDDSMHMRELGDKMIQQQARAPVPGSGLTRGGRSEGELKSPTG